MMQSICCVQVFFKLDCEGGAEGSVCTSASSGSRHLLLDSFRDHAGSRLSNSMTDVLKLPTPGS